jgi:hypothetical protein
MLHEFIHIQVLAKHFVVAFVQRNTMIIDASTGINLPMNVSILFGFIQLKFVCFHERILS